MSIFTLSIDSKKEVFDFGVNICYVIYSLNYEPTPTSTYKKSKITILKCVWSFSQFKVLIIISDSNLHADNSLLTDDESVEDTTPPRQPLPQPT